MSSISAKALYSRVYAMLDDITPQPFDCGKLCGHACCKSSNSGSGMYLYPGESHMYKPLPPWATMEKAAFSYGDDDRCCGFFTCNNTCDRHLRPLACRIFPLVPYKRPGERMKIVMDPRALPLCPLTERGVTARFAKTVEQAMHMLGRIRSVRQFIEAQSELIDDYIKLL